MRCCQTTQRRVNKKFISQWQLIFYARGPVAKNTETLVERTSKLFPVNWSRRKIVFLQTMIHCMKTQAAMRNVNYKVRMYKDLASGILDFSLTVLFLRGIANTYWAVTTILTVAVTSVLICFLENRSGCLKKCMKHIRSRYTH